MKKNNGIQIIVLIFTILIIILIPTDVVWGGQNFQTVPIVPPTATMTSTSTESPTETPTTIIINTSTQPANTLTPTQLPSKTNTIMAPIINTTTATATQVVFIPPVRNNFSRSLLIGLGIIVIIGLLLIPITYFILRKRKSTIE